MLNALDMEDCWSELRRHRSPRASDATVACPSCQQPRWHRRSPGTESSWLWASSRTEGSCDGRLRLGVQFPSVFWPRRAVNLSEGREKVPAEIGAFFRKTRYFPPSAPAVCGAGYGRQASA